MRQLQFRSIQARTLSTLLPIVLIVVVLISLLAYQFSKQKLNEEMGHTASSTLNGVSSSITEQVSRNSLVASSLADAAGQIAKGMTMDEYAALTERWTMLNKLTHGTGLFFASDAFDDGKTYHSVYASRDGDNITASFDYDAASYDYLNQPWYTGTLGNWDNIYYTEPELDEESKIEMITAGKTIRNSDGQAIGVATADFSINSIQDYVNNMDIGKVGHTLLLDREGHVLASSQQGITAGQAIEGSDNDNKGSLATVMQQPNGHVPLVLGGGQYTLYFQTLKDTGWKTGIILSESEIQEPAKEMLNTLLIIGGISLILLAAAILWNNLGMTREIKKVVHMSRRMAVGDYSDRLQVTRRDEFGQMATEFNRILDSTSSILRHLNDQAVKIQTTAAGVAEESGRNANVARHNVEELEQMEQGSATQLQATDESTTAMEEMAVGVQRIAESIQEVADAAQQMEQKTQDGNQQLHKAVRQIDSAKLVMDEGGKMARSLHERAQQINGIIDVIQGINKQTTLLALNASIEAARAGDAGRGFGVVASEISNLSTSVAESTRMITTQITAMQEETAIVLAGMENGASRVTKGMTSLEETSRLFDYIKQDVEQMSAEIQEVSSASEQMSAGAQEITASLENLADVARSTAQKAGTATARSSEQLESLDRLETSAQSLHTVADALNELIARFQTEAAAESPDTEASIADGLDEHAEPAPVQDANSAMNQQATSSSRAEKTANTDETTSLTSNDPSQPKAG
ncbi:methyl-accepting chemotaxis protein [Paenibacillus kandeliae]|uniref:methyl-accepting chemotaxis protein n=1 Tax=Paenibacillus kandeliae TaxID=3231269 RepID=UPI003458D06A